MHHVPPTEQRYANSECEGPAARRKVPFSSIGAYSSAFEPGRPRKRSRDDENGGLTWLVAQPLHFAFGSNAASHGGAKSMETIPFVGSRTDASATVRNPYCPEPHSLVLHQ